MNQLNDITVTDRSGRRVHHQLLPDRDTITQVTQHGQSHTCGFMQPTTSCGGHVTYLLGSLTIHQLLTSLKG